MAEEKLLMVGIGISPNDNDGVIRFGSFCNAHGLEYVIIGRGKTWHGGDLSYQAGGGQKINELREYLATIENRLIVVCDTFDVVPVTGSAEILSKFHRLCKPDEILISSELYCWPQNNLKDKFPDTYSAYKFVNSGVIMGHRDLIYNMIRSDAVSDTDDDQLFFTLKYLAGEKIVIDYKCELAQTLYGDNNFVIHKNRVYNHHTNSYPAIIHGNGSAKTLLNHYQNYLTPEPLANYDHTMNHINHLVHNKPVDTVIKPQQSVVRPDAPAVFIALYIDSSKQEQMELFLEHVARLNYVNKIIYAYDRSNSEFYRDLSKICEITYKPNINSYVFEDFVAFGCQYYFLLEQNCILTNPNVITDLIPLCNGYHRIITPLLHGEWEHSFTNYWGAIDKNGYYKRSSDYLDLINYKLRGLWNCPYVYGAILIDRSIVTGWNLFESTKYGSDRDMNLCLNFRKNTLFMYMCNLDKYGYLVKN